MKFSREKKMKNVIETLKERGFIEAATSEDLKEKCTSPLRVYCGFDPTSDSLHLGNMVGIMGLAWFQKCGHTPVVVLGGATGMIGDPSGKSHERNLLDEATLQKNIAGISKNFQRILDPSNVLFFNNYDWFKSFSMLEFLRDVGKHFRIGQMLGKESVRQRIQSDEGMSYTEFSYQLLQGYDFYHLAKHHNVDLQIGGADQWGNITAGLDLTRRLSGKQVGGLTFPLLVSSDGKKFGKSEKGAIWLSEEKLSPYAFYQHLIRVPDADVIQLLKMLTFLPMERIHQIAKEMDIPNQAQRILAEEVTRLVHGEEGLQKAFAATEVARPGGEATLTVQALEGVLDDLPVVNLSVENVLGNSFLDLLVLIGLQTSRGQARKLIQNGGAYLNNQKIDAIDRLIEQKDLIGGKFLLVQVGKKKKVLVNLEKELEGKSLHKDNE